jgi:hypothetical protein
VKRTFRMTLLLAVLVFAGLGATTAHANGPYLTIGPQTSYTPPSGGSLTIVDPCINKGWYWYGAYRVWGAYCTVHNYYWHRASYVYYDQWNRTWWLDCWSTPVEFLYCTWR